LVLGVDDEPRKERGKFLPLFPAEALEESMLVLEVSCECPVNNAQCQGRSKGDPYLPVEK